MANFEPLQAQSFSLAGGGAVAAATSIILKSFKTIDGVNIAMSDLGAIAYMTLEPGNGTQEEQISFTGVTQNANGTATLTGVKTVLFVSPYTETSGLAKTHAGSTTAVLSNTSGFYNKIPFKANDETITGQWTFDVTPITPPAVSDASTTVKGIAKVSVAPASASEPISTGTNDTRLQQPLYAASAVGTDAYAITLSAANVPAAYAAGQQYTFLADVANTGAATLKINSLAATAIRKNGAVALETGDILAGQIVQVEHDGTNFQLVSPPAGLTQTIPVIRTYLVGGSPATWTKPASTTGFRYVVVEVVGGGGGSGGSTEDDQTGGGGGGGGYSRKIIAVGTLGATETVTTGAGGTAGANSGGDGGTGGTSSFGAHATATGGAGGSGSSTGAFARDGGAGGVGASGDINSTGGGGGSGAVGLSASAVYVASGMGGNSFFGGAANGRSGSGALSGIAGSLYGGGASGAVSGDASDRAGAAGGAGIVVVTEYYT